MKQLWIPYVAPLIVFLAISQFETVWGMRLYPIIYTLKIVLVASLLIAWRREYSEVETSPKFVPVAITLGILLCAAWIGLDHFTPHFKFLGTRAGLNPWTLFPNSLDAILFLAIRFAGLALVVPVMEELFYRSFLLRFIVEPGNFKQIPIGRFDLVSCLGAVFLMALSHPEWLAAAAFSFAMNMLVYRTKSVFACIVAHGTTNLALGIYVLLTHSWQYW